MEVNKVLSRMDNIIIAHLGRSIKEFLSISGGDLNYDTFYQFQDPNNQSLSVGDERVFSKERYDLSEGPLIDKSHEGFTIKRFHDGSVDIGFMRGGNFKGFLQTYENGHLVLTTMIESDNTLTKMYVNDVLVQEHLDRNGFSQYSIGYEDQIKIRFDNWNDERLHGVEDTFYRTVYYHSGTIKREGIILGINTRIGTWTFYSEDGSKRTFQYLDTENIDENIPL